MLTNLKVQGTWCSQWGAE